MFEHLVFEAVRGREARGLEEFRGRSHEQTARVEPVRAGGDVRKTWRKQRVMKHQLTRRRRSPATCRRNRATRAHFVSSFVSPNPCPQRRQVQIRTCGFTRSPARSRFCCKKGSWPKNRQARC